ncbi:MULTISPECIES: SMP-30/gluconolactonase/LRE family protein [unclassified Streptomyces]|uniref:SMP-30/gluconolactonase/LRE family protein n=1 Tax=unclassified Streptomyces TaxID=2593676 RepID=UPI002E0E67D8|nr:MULTISPECIES: SMP-30/gluconolactonase/LRE family protein [unclassified Streptomyces]WSQ76043.1 SMP-30/gluconolactonase/LRE family protein [Streptomyces sp. NBC_01213]WSQ83289.1 SMP-30/gluconolactonase/LRE family protein [Streptomyces sp. NBC_01212]WSR10680.1 SMP-30/gluconolactonase/LRE family protein [Streptomyces sp. NBC_01208]WSR46624.1 SMP-30/gluconolactonase/LRE family protein [Streptomyces sp. NBC_01201]
MQRRHLVRPVAVLAAICALTLTGCGTETREPGTGTGSAGTDRTIRAHKVMQLTQVHEETGMTLLEGPTFDSSGKLIVVDVTAPAGKPKVMRVNVEKKTADGLHTDSRGAYTSAQFSPYDGRLYLSDYAHGEVVSLAPDGSDPRTFFTGKVDGAQMNPDDIAFDEAGNLYVSDSRGLSEGKAHGRVVRIDREGEKATVLADGLAATNGISFDADYRGLWISELTQNRISYLHLDGEGGVTSKHTAIRVDGGIAQTDSIAVDADGNLYQGLHGRAAMAVYDRNGKRLATVEVPAHAAGLESATNVAITPGGTKAYMTVSGPAGGYLYTFDALAKGTRQSNGG